MVSYDESNTLLAEETGEVIFRRPNRFLWRILEPERQTFAVLSSQVIVYDAGIKQVSYLDVSELSGSDLFQILINPKVLQNSSYEITRVDQEYTVRSTSEEALFLEIVVSLEGEMLDKIMVYDLLGGSTETYLSDVKENLEIEDDVFDIAIPEGTDVIGIKQDVIE